MEEIRWAAITFFEQNPELKNPAHAQFSTMPGGTQGRVTKKALASYSFSPELLSELDTDGDGYLTFDDFLVLHYIHKTRPICQSCGVLVKVHFYTCIRCFKNKSQNTYDLCPSCYLKKKFSHEHVRFLDNYAIVKSIRTAPVAPPVIAKLAATMGTAALAGTLGAEAIQTLVPHDVHP